MPWKTSQWATKLSTKIYEVWACKWELPRHCYEVLGRAFHELLINLETSFDLVSCSMNGSFWFCTRAEIIAHECVMLIVVFFAKPQKKKKLNQWLRGRFLLYFRTTWSLFLTPYYFWCTVVRIRMLIYTWLYKRVEIWERKDTPRIGFSKQKFSENESNPRFWVKFLLCFFV